jgi:parallel beta-helix repeat protein
MPHLKTARSINVEALEDRRMLAVFYVANPASYQITADTAPPGLSNGDAVTWAGGGQFNSVANLTYGTNAFTSINAAIAAASNGDTIDVAAGAYHERVNVNKSVTLDGAQFGVDARGGRGAAANEAIVDGQDLGGGQRSTAFYVTANDATIDGFTVQNTNSANVFGAGIDLSGGTSGAHVVNDIVQNNIIGLFLSNASSTDQTVIQHDLFQNNNQAGPASGNGIYTDQFTAGGALTNVLIDGNSFVGNSNAGLNLGSSQAASQSHVAISNNTFANNGNAVDLFNATSSSLTGNTISGSTGSQIFIGGGVDGLQIANNVIQNGHAKGINIGPDVGGYPNPNANITINDNSISGNAGLALSIDSGRYTGTLDARENWWGTNDATAIQSQISGTVAFSPYLDNGSNGVSSGPGFQGDASHLDVTSAGGQIGPVGAIQAAVDAAPVGGTVTIQPGTYHEKVTINKKLTLLGAQHGVDARTGRGPASAETIVDGADLGGGQRSTALYVTADDVTIDGFTVQGTTSANVFGAGIVLAGGTSGAHIVNDIVQNNLVGLFLSNASATDQAVIQHDLFQNNNLTGPAGGQAIYTDSSVAKGALNDVLIDANKIVGNPNGGIGISLTDTAKPASHLTISNNVIDSNGRGIYLYDTQSSTISGNDITNDTTPTDGGTSVALGLFGDVNGLSITNNNIHGGNLRGIRIINANVNPNQNVTINDNSIFGFPSGSVVVDAGGYTGTLDARQNWWGTNTASTILGQTSGTVAFSPYLDNGSNGNASGPGFQGDLTHLDATALGAQVGSAGPIEQAIQAAPAGGTVTIQAGTYTEGDVVIDKNLTLQANGAVVLTAPTAGSGTGITITGNPQNVTIAGFAIGEFASSLSSNGGDTLNLIDLSLNNRMVVTPFGLGPPVTNSPISNVNHLNLTTTVSSPRVVKIGADGSVGFFDGSDSIALTNVSHLSATTGAGNDTFSVAPLPSTSIAIDAGDPTPPASPGDTLNLTLSGTTGASLSVAGSPQGFSGSWTFSNRQPVNFSHIETLSPATVASQGNATINAAEAVNTGPVVVATFTDPSGPGPLSNYSADIQWGDGATSAGTVTFDSASGTFFVIASHTYGEDGSRTLTVTVHRLGGPDVVINGAAIVAEPPIVVTLAPVGPAVGHEQTLFANVSLGSFAHGNNSEPASNFTAIINWGDGTTSTGTVSQGPAADSFYAVAGSHSYRDEGHYSISVAISDDTASATIQTTAVITEEALPSGSKGTSNELFVSEVYRDLLNRPVDATGLAYWSAKIDAGAARADVATSIQNSDEYRQIEVQSLYQTYLHRDAEAGALAADAKLLAHGETAEQLAASIVSSDEYFQRRAGGTNDGFLDALFQDALHRPIDAGSKAFFEQPLAHGGTRGQAADLVFGSREYHAEVVQNIYLQTLDRGADAAGDDFWATQLDHGQRDEQIRAVIMGSQEYFAKTALGVEP